MKIKKLIQIIDIVLIIATIIATIVVLSEYPDLISERTYLRQLVTYQEVIQQLLDSRPYLIPFYPASDLENLLELLAVNQAIIDGVETNLNRIGIALFVEIFIYIIILRRRRKFIEPTFDLSLLKSTH